VTTVRLPAADRRLVTYRLHGPGAFRRPLEPIRARVAIAAAHVVADPLADPDLAGAAAIDWEATLAYRHHLWSWGLGVAEAMDTAQRGMGIGWVEAADLIRRTAREARAGGGRLWAGASTDQLRPGSAGSLDEIVAAYARQCELVEAEGAIVVLMASRELARVARSADDYRSVYDRVLSQLSRPAVIHWLGEPFDAALAGYWGEADLRAAADRCLEIVAANAAKVEGVKLSVLDAELEVDLRRRLPAGVRLYTGDDNRFAGLIEGDGERHSDALLGIFDAIAPAASTALQALDSGDVEGFRTILEPAERLSRVVFRSPTQHYKTGLVFLAWLNGHQPHFRMVAGQESMRSPLHLAEVFMAADGAGLLDAPERSATRMRAYLALAGIEA